MSKRIIICRRCREQRENWGHNLCHNCYTLTWQEENPEKKRDNYRRYYQRNQERIRQKQHIWCKKNREKHNANGCRWARENPKKNVARTARYFARKRLLPYTLTNRQMEEIVSGGGGRCFYCGNVDNLEFDHFVPLSAGGGTTRANIVLACKRCNTQKGKKMPFEFLTQLELIFYDKTEFDSKLL